MTAVLAPVHHRLYQAVQSNRAKEALEIVQNPEFVLDDFEIQSDQGQWNLLDWASYHGNETVSKLILQLFIKQAILDETQTNILMTLTCARYLACGGASPPRDAPLQT
jgi:ankyrin repeat protein